MVPDTMRRRGLRSGSREAVSSDDSITNARPPPTRRPAACTFPPGGAIMTTRTAFREPEDFTRSEGLRALLNRLHEGGPGAWQSDPVAADLMAYAAEKYGALARKHGLDRSEERRVGKDGAMRWGTEEGRKRPQASR